MDKQSFEEQITRRKFLWAMVALGGAVVAAPILAACFPRALGTATPSPTPRATTVKPFVSPEATSTPTSMPKATMKPSVGPEATSTPTPAPTASKPFVSPEATSTPTAAPSPTASPTPIPTEEKLMTQVVLVKTSDRAEGVTRALDLLGINPVRGKTVFLKPNFNSADPAPGSTHNDTLRSLIEALWEMGAKEITLADRSGMDDTNQVMRQKGIFQMAEELDFSIINLDELGEDDWVHIRPQGSHWRDGFLFARPCLEAECVVQTCCLKTHRFGGHFTLSLKNSVALVPRHGYNYMTELHSSPYQRLMIAELNEPYSPDLIVVDGIEAFT
ncbi:MAG: DUF362 domain-containing protein, partial [Anaerolineae bacterium]